MAQGMNDCGLIESIKAQFDLTDNDINTYSPLTLAFIGDGIYGVVVKTVITLRGNCPANSLNSKVTYYVKAVSQAKIFDRLSESGELSPAEESVLRRGRNAKSPTVAKNASVGEYRKATGLEALMGYLYLLGQTDRLLELVKAGMDYLDELREQKKQ